MDAMNLYNTIRENALGEYADRIPEGTRTNIDQVGAAILDPSNAVVTNAFMASLLNLVALQVIHTRRFSNPLKPLKKGSKPLGDTVEEIYTNFYKAKVYDPEGKDLLARTLPDTKTVFHRMNRQDYYPVTINYEELRKAFMSWEKLDVYFSSIIDQLYNSSELDEFILMKQIFAEAIENNALKTVEVADPLTGEANGKEFIKAVKTVSGGMVFPSSMYNAYTDAQDTDTKEILTLSRKADQVLILSNEVDVAVNIDVLASIFNMSVAEFNDTKKFVIDAFPVENMRAALVDEAFFQIYDDLPPYFTDFRNPKGLYTNYYLHIWQTFGYSILVNAVAFIAKTEETANEGGQTEGQTEGQG